MLKRMDVDIVPDDTALTLNTKCFEAAIESFGSLIDEIAGGTLQPEKQDFSNFRYFGRNDKPGSGCLLDWERPAAELATLVRALDFGHYENPVGAAKMTHNGRALVVRRATVREGFAPAGLVNDLTESEMVIGTGQDLLVVTALECPRGSSYTIKQAAEILGLRAGERLDNKPVRAILESEDKAVAVNERFWIKRLAALGDVHVPRAGAPVPGTTDFHELELHHAGWEEDKLIAAFAAFLGRLGGDSRFYLGMSTAHCTDGLRAITAGQVPLRVDFRSGEGFTGLNKRLDKELARVRQRGSWLVDVISRYPGLRERGQLRPDQLFPAAVGIHRAERPFHPEPGNLMALVVGKETPRLLFRRDAYSERAAEGLRRHFEIFLEAVTNTPEKTLAHLDLLTADERTRVIETWNKTETEFDQTSRIHELFEGHANKTPNAPALAGRGQLLSYGELDQRANRVAARLRELNVRPDEPVGIYLERTPDLMVAVLGVLKAGAAYLPMDPAYPADRITYMIEDAGVRLILTETATAAGLGSHEGTEKILIDGPLPEASAYSGGPGCFHQPGLPDLYFRLHRQNPRVSWCPTAPCSTSLPPWTRRSPIRKPAIGWR